MPTTENILEGVDDDAKARAVAQAEADVAAGRVVPHDAVMKWLKSVAVPSVPGDVILFYRAVASGSRRSRQMAGMLDPKLPENPLPDTIELLLGLNRVTEELLTGEIVAMDIYAKGTHEPIDFVGHLMLSPFPRLVKDVEEVSERGANLVPPELESQPRGDLP